MRALVVDDDPSIREVLEIVLDQDGYEVRTASNGRIALEILSDWQPAVILLDLMMPVLDGRGFRTEQLRDAHLAPIPVIVLSAANDARQQASTMGAAACLQKPFDADQLLATVRSLTAVRDLRKPAPQGMFTDSVPLS